MFKLTHNVLLDMWMRFRLMFRTKLYFLCIMLILKTQARLSFPLRGYIKAQVSTSLHIFSLCFRLHL
jgi:hypothetical protein